MDRTLTAFSGDYWIATGDEDEVRAALRAMGDDAQNILLFDDSTGRQVDIDLQVDAPPRVRSNIYPSLAQVAGHANVVLHHPDFMGSIEEIAATRPNQNM